MFRILTCWCSRKQWAGINLQSWFLSLPGKTLGKRKKDSRRWLSLPECVWEQRAFKAAYVGPSPLSRTTVQLIQTSCEGVVWQPALNSQEAEGGLPDSHSAHAPCSVNTHLHNNLSVCFEVPSTELDRSKSSSGYCEKTPALGSCPTTPDPSDHGSSVLYFLWHVGIRQRDTSLEVSRRALDISAGLHSIESLKSCPLFWPRYISSQ